MGAGSPSERVVEFEEDRVVWWFAATPDAFGASGATGTSPWHLGHLTCGRVGETTRRDLQWGQRTVTFSEGMDISHKKRSEKFVPRREPASARSVPYIITQLARISHHLDSEPLRWAN